MAATVALVLSDAALSTIGLSFALTIRGPPALPLWDEWVMATDIRTQMSQEPGQIVWLLADSSEREG